MGEWIDQNPGWFFILILGIPFAMMIVGMGVTLLQERSLRNNPHRLDEDAYAKLNEKRMKR